MIPLRDENPPKTIPVVNTGLILANLSVFVYQNFFVPGGAKPLILRLGFIPYCNNSSPLLDIDSDIEWNYRVWNTDNRWYNLVCSCRPVCHRACPHYHDQKNAQGDPIITLLQAFLVVVHLNVHLDPVAFEKDLENAGRGSPDKVPAIADKVGIQASTI